MGKRSCRLPHPTAKGGTLEREGMPPCRHCSRASVNFLSHSYRLNDKHTFCSSFCPISCWVIRLLGYSDEDRGPPKKWGCRKEIAQALGGSGFSSISHGLRGSGADCPCPSRLRRWGTSSFLEITGKTALNSARAELAPPCTVSLR